MSLDYLDNPIRTTWDLSTEAGFMTSVDADKVLAFAKGDFAQTRYRFI